MYYLQIEGKRIGQTYKTWKEAQKAVSQMFAEADRRLHQAALACCFRTVNATNALLKKMRSTLTIVKMEKNEIAEVSKSETKNEYSETANKYRRLSSCHRKYTDI